MADAVHIYSFLLVATRVGYAAKTFVGGRARRQTDLYIWQPSSCILRTTRSWWAGWRYVASLSALALCFGHPFSLLSFGFLPVCLLSPRFSFFFFILCFSLFIFSFIFIVVIIFLECHHLASCFFCFFL